MAYCCMGDLLRLQQHRVCVPVQVTVPNGLTAVGPGVLRKRTCARTAAGEQATFHYSVPYAVPAAQIGLAAGEHAPCNAGANARRLLMPASCRLLPAAMYIMPPTQLPCCLSSAVLMRCCVTQANLWQLRRPQHLPTPAPPWQRQAKRQVSAALGPHSVCARGLWLVSVCLSAASTRHICTQSGLVWHQPALVDRPLTWSPSSPGLWLSECCLPETQQPCVQVLRWSPDLHRPKPQATWALPATRSWPRLQVSASGLWSRQDMGPICDADRRQGCHNCQTCLSHVFICT